MKTLGLFHDDATVLLAILAESNHPRAPEFAERVRSADSFHMYEDEREVQKRYTEQRILNLRPMP